MNYTIIPNTSRPVHKIVTRSGFTLLWSKGDQLSRKRFHFSDGEKYYAYNKSWSIIAYLFGYNISLTLK